MHYTIMKLIFLIEQEKILNREQAKLDDLLTIPVADRPNWSVDEINKEISNSAQTLLGYVLDGLTKELDVQKFQT